MKCIRLTGPIVAVALAFAWLGFGCGGGLEPVTAPTLPASIPGYTEVDPATGLHMTGTPTLIDPKTYRLKVTGKVSHELQLSYDDLRRMDKVTASPALVCPGFFTDVASWSGVPVEAVLAKAGIQAGATEIKFVADNYSATLSLEKALKPENLLAYEVDGRTLPALHGFPIRAVLPGETGSKWVKWLLEISVQ